MNLTQNDRLKQVTSDTLIVGVDVGSHTHFCRAFDWRGFELSRRVFKFSNTGMGFIKSRSRDAATTARITIVRVVYDERNFSFAAASSSCSRAFATPTDIKKKFPTASRYPTATPTATV